MNFIKNLCLFTVTFFLNALLWIRFLTLPLLLLTAHFLFKITLIPFFISLGCWALYILVMTLFFSSAVKSSRQPDRVLKNANPYSPKDEDYKKMVAERLAKRKSQNTESRDEDEN